MTMVKCTDVCVRWRAVLRARSYRPARLAPEAKGLVERIRCLGSRPAYRGDAKIGWEGAICIGHCSLIKLSELSKSSTADPTRWTAGSTRAPPRSCPRPLAPGRP